MDALRCVKSFFQLRKHDFQQENLPYLHHGVICDAN